MPNGSQKSQNEPNVCRCSHENGTKRNGGTSLLHHAINANYYLKWTMLDANYKSRRNQTGALCNLPILVVGMLE